MVPQPVAIPNNGCVASPGMYPAVPRRLNWSDRAELDPGLSLAQIEIVESGLS